MLKLFFRILVDACIVIGTIALSIAGLLLFSWISLLLHIPMMYTEGIGVVLFAMLLATPYWIFRFSRRDNPDEVNKEAQTIKKFAQIFTWACVVGILAISLLVRGETVVTALIVIAESFFVPLLFLYRRNRSKSEYDTNPRPH